MLYGTTFAIFVRVIGLTDFSTILEVYRRRNLNSRSRLREVSLNEGRSFILRKNKNEI